MRGLNPGAARMARCATAGGLAVWLALGLLALGPRSAWCLSDQDYQHFLARSPEFKQADQDLNRAYRSLLLSLDEPGKEGLRQSQKSWLKRRDDRARTIVKDQGLSPAQAYARLTRERAWELDARAAGGGKAPDWAGEWERVEAGRFNSATLTVSKVTPLGFSFELEAMNGGNSGEVSGSARLQGSQARFEEDGCVLVFKLSKGRIALEANDGCQSLAGMGVHFDGRYARAGSEPAPPAPPLAPWERTLAALTGQYYGLFRDTMQLESVSRDQDGFDAEVRSHGVRGLFTAQESIVMHDKGGKIWAAVIDGDEVRYFTNDPPWADRLPKTIEDWRSRFRDKKVIFMPAVR